MSQPTLTVEDNTDEILKVIASFKRDAVLVGIPAADSKRKDDNEINNATLLFINNFGSPANNIPARPVMEIGIRAAQDQIAEEFKKAIQGTWKRGVVGLGIYYERVGIIASNSVKKTINDQIGIDAPAESTLAGRKAKGFKGTKALLVTGQMRNAITYVVNPGGL